ncbi:hypothetical protein ATY79_22410 [Rhizobium sp. R693]|nr:hypothetical protein ATY79_22410 [Rhizobium sp. R693]
MLPPLKRSTLKTRPSAVPTTRWRPPSLTIANIRREIRGIRQRRTQTTKGSRTGRRNKPETGEVSRRAIGKRVGSFLLGAMRTAVNDVALLDAVPDVLRHDEG